MAAFCSPQPEYPTNRDAAVPPPTPRLLTMAQALRTVDKIGAALRTVTHTASALTASDQATLRLVDPNGRGLLLSARTGDAMHRGGAGRFGMRGEKSLLGWCVEHGKPARVNDVRKDARFQIRPGQTWIPSGVLVAPLLGRNDVIGVLSTARADGADYDPDDLQLLELVAAMVAPHVEVEMLSELAETDPLTLLHNRRHLEKRFPIEFEAAQRHGRPLAIVSLDLDHFKNVNDQHGHPTGDEILVELARRLRQACRTTDVLVRVGGEEFLLLLPDTHAVSALRTAERVLSAIRDEPMSTQVGPLRVTASAGVCAVRPYDDLRSSIDRVDALLYAAKDEGRDRVVGKPDYRGTSSMISRD